MLQKFLQRRFGLVPDQLLDLRFELLQGDHFDRPRAIERVASFAVLITTESEGFPFVSNQADAFQNLWASSRVVLPEYIRSIINFMDIA